MGGRDNGPAMTDLGNERRGLEWVILERKRPNGFRRCPKMFTAPNHIEPAHFPLSINGNEGVARGTIAGTVFMGGRD
ncbi:MAG: hypothetical protein ACREHV_17440, partial [Rhizomicrobium sp.]